jgi:epidermal growth factor receptor substrate 15
VNEYDSEIINQKNNINRLNNELKQVNLSVKNKDALIEQLKNQIEELNDLIAQSEEDLKLFEENKQQEFKEYSDQIEVLIQEQNILRAQNMELTENLSLANENMKQLNELISDKYADVEAELLKQTSNKENLEKKYKDIFKHMKNKQNLLNQENNKLKEIINNQEGSFDNFGQNEIKMNNIQNLNLYKKINGENNESKLNFETPIGTNRSTKNNKNNFINIDENIEQTFGNNNINNNNSGNNMNYKNNFTYDINSSSYIDTKEARQKRTLNNFKQLLDKMDEKIEIQ